MNIGKIGLALGALLLAGCSVTHYPTYEAGGALPTGKVLVIGQLALDPGVAPGEIGKNIVIVNGPKADEARMMMSPKAEEPVKRDSIVPFSPTGASSMHLSFDHPSVVLMDPGIRYVRMGIFTLSAGTGWRRNAAGEMRGDPTFHDLYLYGDVKLDIPADAKAVYIGTLRYRHDGAESSRVTVEDDYKKAMAALDARKLGITSRDVVKKLAQVVREN